MNTYSSLQTPTVITLNDNTGKVLKTLVTNQKLKETLAQYQLPKKEFFYFPYFSEHRTQRMDD
jgi:dipeptidyl-peptidase-4